MAGSPHPCEQFDVASLNAFEREEAKLGPFIHASRLVAKHH
jgi:hypothetical protein